MAKWHFLCMYYKICPLSEPKSAADFRRWCVVTCWHLSTFFASSGSPLDTLKVPRFFPWSRDYMHDTSVKYGQVFHKWSLLACRHFNKRGPLKSHASSVFLDRWVLTQLQIKMSFKKSGSTKLRLVVHQGLNCCFAMNRLLAIVWKNILEWCCHIRPISERHNPFNFLLIIRQKTLIRQPNYSFTSSSSFDMLHFESFQQYMPRTKDRISSHAQQTPRKITTHSWTFQKINTFMGLEEPRSQRIMY